jgi:hypothetical protein
MRMMQDPVSKLILPTKFIDERTSLKNTINELVEKIVRSHGHIDGTYFITFHAKFDKYDPSVFKISEPKLTNKLPSFISNSLVYYVNNTKGICELLWMVAPKKKGEKLKVEFNTEGVAYLQAKGAMPTAKG